MQRSPELEPVRLVPQAVQRDVVAAVLQAVEVFEHVAVATPDAGALGHVDHAQPARVGADRPRVQELAPLGPEVALRGTLAFVHLGAPGHRLQVIQRRRRQPARQARRQRSTSS